MGGIGALSSPKRRWFSPVETCRTAGCGPAVVALDFSRLQLSIYDGNGCMGGTNSIEAEAL